MERGCYLYVKYYALTFGALVSVHWFLAFSNALTWILRRLGFCIGSFFFDDGNFVEPRQTVESGLRLLIMLLTSLECKCHTEAPKSGVGDKVRMLGAGLDFSSPELVIVDIPWEKRLQLQELLIQAADRPELKTLQRCLGVFIFLLTTTVFRSGYHRIRGLFTLTNPAFAPSLLKHHAIVRHYLLGLSELAMSVQPLRLRPALFLEAVDHLEVDAMYTESEARTGGVMDTMVGRVGFKFDVPHSIILAKAKIMYLEVLAVYIGLVVFRQFTPQKLLRIVSDNISGMFSIIQGYSRTCLHTNRLVGLIHDYIRDHNSSAWFEYRQSELNDADCISRNKVPEGLQLLAVNPKWIPEPTQEEVDFIHIMANADDFPTLLKSSPDKMSK